MNLILKNFLKRSITVFSISLFFMANAKATDFVSDTVRYFCLPHSVSASLNPNISKHWKCAEMDWNLDDEFEMRFFRHGWSSKKVTLKGLEQLSNYKLQINLSHPFKPAKTIVLSDFCTADEIDNIREITFFATAENLRYQFEFSRDKKAMKIINENGNEQVFALCAGQCYIGHLIATSISMLLETI